MLATFMEVLDTSIANVSLPHIAGDLGATIAAGNVVVGHRLGLYRSLAEGPATLPDTPPALLRYETTGTGFLRHMVRTIAGTLVEVGLGRRPAGDIPVLLASRQRAAAGRYACGSDGPGNSVPRYPCTPAPDRGLRPSPGAEEALP